MNSEQFINFSKPFIEATKNIFETMVFTKIDPGKPTFKKDHVSRGDITASIGLSGTVNIEGEESGYRGQLNVSFPMETYLKVASAMLMEEHTEFSQEIVDVGGEISNMIMGNAKRDLVKVGYNTSMCIPSIIHGQNHSISYPPNTSIILIPIESQHGPFFLEICYAQGEG